MNGRWIKPAGKTYAPSAVVSVVCRGRPIADPDGRHHVPTSWGGCEAVASRFHLGKWTYPHAASFTDPDAFHDWLESWGRERQSTAVVAPIASDVLTLSRWWDRLEAKKVRWAKSSGVSPNHPAERSRPPHDDNGEPAGADAITPPPATPEAGYIVSRMVLQSKPDIVSYSTAGRSFSWVSGRQYFDLSEESLAESVGFRWESDPVPAGPNEVVSRPPHERAALWLRLFQSLADWWRAVDGGPWGRTLGQLGMNFFRKRLAPKTVLSHQNEYAKQLELSGLFGGRASVWFYGDVGDPATRAAARCIPPPEAPYPPIPVEMRHYDVRSMYPHLLASEDFPVRLLTVRDNRPVESVESLLRDYCVIARVLVRSGSGEYPYRHGDRLTFPAGEFATTLCGPELARAIRDGEVLQAFTVATYQRGRPFAPMMNELMQLRWAAEGKGNQTWAMFVKSLSNAIGGKFAQRAARWVERPNIRAQTRWGEFVMRGEAPGEIRKFRARAGLVWEKVNDELKGRPLGSCFCYLTSYGRSLMRAVREGLPPCSVLSQDTDGVWVLPTRSVPAAARPECSAIPAPALRWTETATHGRFWGANHYWTPSGWVLAGFSSPVPSACGLAFRDSWTSNPAVGSADRPPRHVWHHTRDSELTMMPTDGVIQSDGWAVPCPVDQLPPPV